MPAFLSLNMGSLGLGDPSLAEKVRLAKAHGFAAIDVGFGPTPEQADAVREAITAAGLRPGSFGLPVHLYASDADFSAALDKLAQIAPMAKRAGYMRTGTYMMCASKDRDFASNLAWHADRFRRIMAILRPLGIELGIEFLGEHLVAKIGPHPFIHNVAGMKQLLVEIGPGTGIVFDVFHWYCSGGTVDKLAAELKDVPITCVHLNDAVPERSRLEQIDNERRLPGETGVIDSKGVLQVLRQLGYNVPAIVEPFKPWTTQLPAMGLDAACAKIASIVNPML